MALAISLLIKFSYNLILVKIFLASCGVHNTEANVDKVVCNSFKAYNSRGEIGTDVHIAVSFCKASEVVCCKVFF